MEVIWPKECLDQVAIIQGMIDSLVQKQIDDLNSRSGAIKPRQEEVIELQRTILNDPYLAMLRDQIVKVYNLYSPTYILNKDEVNMDLINHS
jgi:hypothetical protein